MPRWRRTGAASSTSSGPRPRTMPAVEADPALSRGVAALPGRPTTFYLAFNLTEEPFQDKKVREAFAYAFDREAYCREIATATACRP